MSEEIIIEYKTIYVNIGNGRCCSVAIPIYNKELLPKDFILRPETLIQIALADLLQENQQLKILSSIEETDEARMNALLQIEKYCNQEKDGLISGGEAIEEILKIIDELKGENNE